MDDDLPIVDTRVGPSCLWTPPPGAPGATPLTTLEFLVPLGVDRATLVGVRGDSRRDLYSKTLALCGLGVLAGAGALVDYWPVGVRFHVPDTSELSTSSVAPASGVTSEDPLVMLAGLLDTQAVVATAQPSDHTHLAAASLLASADYESLPIVAVGYDLGTAVDIQSMPTPAVVSARGDAPMLPGDQVHLMAPGPEQFDGAFPQAAATDSGSGMITGAFRKTGTSIVRTGVWTGSSVVGAVRVVGSMVRRALPD